MRKRLTIAIILVLAILSFAASRWRDGQPPVVCEEPYIQYGYDCCMDSNYNRVCDDREKPKTEPLIIPQELVVEEIVDEIVVEPPNVTAPETAPKKSFRTPPKEYCGDGICTDRTGEYPDVGVFCNDLGCTIAGEYTENSFSCPRDCGLTCASTVYLKVGSCEILNGKISIVLESVGRSPIAGVSFVYQSDELRDYMDKAFLPQTAETDSAYNLKGLNAAVAHEYAPHNMIWKDMAAFELDIARWEAALGGNINKVQIIPSINHGGVSQECTNQKLAYMIDRCRGYDVQKK